MSAVAPGTSRALAAAATQRIAVFSVAPVQGDGAGVRLKSDPSSASMRSLRPCAARVSPSQHTICTGRDG